MKQKIPVLAQFVPTIVMTGHNSGRVREELTDKNIPILSKPVRSTELRSMVLAKALDAPELPN